VTLQQLQKLEQDAKSDFLEEYPTRNMGNVVDHIVKPLCKKDKQSYAWLINHLTGLLLIEIFVSHSWREYYERFVAAIEAAQPQLPRGVSNLWICAFAIRQGDASDAAEVASQIGSDPLTAPFTSALRESKSFLVVRNCNCDLYTRVWCVWEIFLAASLGKTEPGVLTITGENPPDYDPRAIVDVSTCEASVASDKFAIMTCIAQDRTASGTMLEECNRIVSQIKHM